MSYSRAAIRAAIYQTAQHIKRHPDCYRYMNQNVPPYISGTKASALGWIGFFLGLEVGTHDVAVAKTLNVAPNDFYSRLGELTAAESRHAMISQPCSELVIALLKYSELRFGERREIDTVIEWSACSWKPKDLA